MFRRYPYPGWLLLSLLLFSAVSILSYIKNQQLTEPYMARAVEKDLQKREKALAQFVEDRDQIANLFSGRPNLDMLESISAEAFYIYAYHFDELIYWNNQEVLEKCPYQSDGQPRLVENERGSFVKQCFRFPYLDSSFQLTVLSPVAIRYPFENAYLQSHFKAGDHIPMSSRIHTHPGPARYAIKNLDGADIFYLEFSSIPHRTWVPGASFLWLLALAAIHFIIWLQLLTIYLTRKQRPLIGFLITLGVVLLFRWVTFQFGLPFNLGSLPIFHPYIYASSWFLPSLGDLLISLFCLLWILVFMIRHMQRPVIRPRPWQRIWSIGTSLVFAALLVLLTYGYIYLIRSLVLDSNISFSVSSFSTVTAYTLIGLLAIGMVTVVYFLFLYLVYIQMVAVLPVRVYRYLMVAGAGLLLLFAMGPAELGPLSFLVLSILILCLIFFDTPGLRYRSDLFAPQMLFWAFIVCMFSTGLVQHFHDVKEKETRKRYAEKVIKQRDYVTEYEFSNIAKLIQNDRQLKRFFRAPSSWSHAAMEERFEALYFGGQLDKYETQVYFFDRSRNAVFPRDEVEFSTLDARVKEAAPTSDPRLFYRENAQDGRYYIAQIPIDEIEDSQRIGYVFIDLATKVSGGESVYPELLHPGNIEPLGKGLGYSFGVYVNQHLITQGGDYSFSVYLPQDTFTQVYNFMSWEGSSELWYKPDSSKTVIVIRFYKLWLEVITLFSYMFGVLMLIVGTIFLYRWGLSLFTRPKKASKYLNMTMRSRIHLSMLGIVLVSFLIIGLVTIVFFRLQYRQSGITKLRSTMQVVERLTWQELSKRGAFEGHGSFASLAKSSGFRYFISGLASTHGLDINLFGPDGSLLVSSQENIYDKILLSRLMPQKAYTELTRMNSTLVVENEQIGGLRYLSSYVPVKDEKGKTFGYLNVPFFSSEKELNFQISNILVALINLYSFIFLVSGLITVIIMRRLTRTLGMMIGQFGRLNLSSNELIDWPYDDEVGLLVTEYNKMVKKLEENAALLARNEREMAWREMARQVAHEITNPLTPMKLNIQYLQQALQKGHPRPEALIRRVCESLIEQIDNLSYIASEFSNFAKMPEARPNKLVINDLLETALALYRNEENLALYTEIPAAPLIVYADRSHLIRVFNNLLENAVQSIPEDREGIIRVVMRREGDYVRITIQDNGTGIPEEALSKVFQPYFTTKSTGTGLGLAMTRKMIEFWNGSIGFETEPGKGSQFYIRLPLADAEASQT